MPSYAGPSTPARSGDVAGTLRLLAYLALAVVLIVLDHRGGWLRQTRQQASLLVQPLWMVAGWPGRVAERVYEDAGTLRQLTAENTRLRNQVLVDQARMARMRTIAADNERLRGLLDAAQRGSLDVQLAPILDVDLDPARQRLVLDAGGLVGQIIATTPMHATVLLLTDPSHAVPVAVARSGVRLVAYGEGRSDELRLPSIPLSSDIKVGDVLVTSGLGGRFPAGFPVGTIIALRPDDSRAFLLGTVRPAAQLDRGRDVLLLRSTPAPSRDSGLGTGGSAEASETAGAAAIRSGVSAGSSSPTAPAPSPTNASSRTPSPVSNRQPPPPSPQPPGAEARR